MFFSEYLKRGYTIEDSLVPLTIIILPKPLTFSGFVVSSLYFLHQQMTLGNYSGNIEGPQFSVLKALVKNSIMMDER